MRSKTSHIVVDKIAGPAFVIMITPAIVSGAFMIYLKVPTYFLLTFLFSPPHSIPSDMVDSRPSSTDEKATVVADQPPKGFFARRKAAKAAKQANDVEQKEKGDDVSADVKPVEPQFTPVPFFQLFRYAAFPLKEHYP